MLFTLLGLPPAEVDIGDCEQHSWIYRQTLGGPGLMVLNFLVQGLGCFWV